MLKTKSGCSETKTEKEKDCETIRIEKTKNICPMCEDYSRENAAKSVAVLCCEGACLRGEIARHAANMLCHSLVPDKTVRICLGGAFTKDTGQRNLVKKAKKVLALEGCFIKCASRMMKAVVPEFKPEVIIADGLCNFNRNLFGVNEMPEYELKAHSLEVAQEVMKKIKS